MSDMATEIIDPESTPAMRSLRGVVCPVCSGGKLSNRTFCDGCLLAASPTVRAMLCVSAEAYPAAFGRAFLVLGVEAKV